MKVLTVKKLSNILNDLCARGEGNKIILTSNWEDPELGDYRTVREIDATGDTTGQYVYLEPNDPEKEIEFWEARE